MREHQENLSPEDLTFKKWLKKVNRKEIIKVGMLGH